MTRGQRITPERLREFVNSLAIPAEAKAQLLAMTPANYIGNAVTQAQAI